MSPAVATIALIPQLAICVGALKAWEWFESHGHSIVGTLVAGMSLAVASILYACALILTGVS